MLGISPKNPYKSSRTVVFIINSLDEVTNPHEVQELHPNSALCSHSNFTKSSNENILTKPSSSNTSSSHQIAKPNKSLSIPQHFNQVIKYSIELEPSP
ncbi:hypothetical protein CDAR_601791 [Caerostris darwini]|uniref:Uncharacterized protein n=1 Tax=Caerostris darwini TaxID=1538125 RepID=A0AAV4MMY2_9ARAC|nr:hypothetical protein CDAR_601791 [Caerostris darwini]